MSESSDENTVTTLLH